jgi:maltooligosyltrehalose trehalohydrolase
MQATLPSPHEPATFERCKLNRDESRPAHVRLFTDLIALRRREVAFSQQRAGAVDGAVLGPELFVLRYQTERAADERLLVVNFGLDVVAAAFPDPLMAPPAAKMRWAIAWSSESPEYGGLGTPDVVDANGWRIPGYSATVLKAIDTEQTDGGHRTDGN